MIKPNERNDKAPKHYHYAAHLGATWMMQHSNASVHTLIEELKTLPPQARTMEIAQSLMKSLHEVTDQIPMQKYAAIHHQLSESIRACK